MSCITDDLFHSCALVAFVEVARECGGWPDSEAVKQRAYQHHERELAEQSVARSAKVKYQSGATV